MIVCPNCNHQNPDGAVQCEACYTPLPAMTACPNCGATVQADASFCGQCGSNLQGSQPAVAESGVRSGASSQPVSVSPSIPALIPPDPLVMPEPLVMHPAAAEVSEASPSASAAMAPDVSQISVPDLGAPPPPVVSASPPAASASAEAPPPIVARTQLQQQTARLLHVQTDTMIELPQTLSVVHIGKPNDRIPPDIDVSGFPNSEIVSRIHADVRVEGDAFYIEDVGSSNGTYINNTPLPMGNRHRLRSGDRVGLGKGDKVTFLFQLS